MVQKKLATTLQEDFQMLGVTSSGAAPMQGIEPEITGDNNDGSDDPLCAEDVNVELFDRIMGLPYENMSAEDVEEVLEALKEKNLPEDEQIKERATEVVDFLIGEAAAKRQRVFKAGKTSKKASLRCPAGSGLRKDPNNPRRCIRAAAAAGGAGKLAKESRKKKRWAKGGKGSASQRKSLRSKGRRHEGLVSPFAKELGGLLEGNEVENASVRDDILDRMGRILEMLSDEFMDPSVTEVFEEAYEPIAENWEAGRLDEDVMESDEFISMIKPVVALITKSLDRIDRQENGEPGNE